MPGVNKAQLIEGIVYMPSPVSSRHAEPHGLIMTWLGYYRAKTPGVKLLDNATVRLDEDNLPQPDALLLLPPGEGVQARIDSDHYVAGPPAIVVEIATTSTSIDMNSKREAYRRNGVNEYIVWRTIEGDIDWFVLDDGQYRQNEIDNADIIHSHVFPGLRLDVPAMLRDDLAAVFAAVDQGCATDEHAVFVKRLAPPA